MIDWGRIADLRSEIGPEDFEEVVNLFLDEADEVVARLGKALCTPGPGNALLRDDLHFLKGAALNLGFRALADLCQTGERQAAPLEEADIAQIIAVYGASRRAFIAREGAEAA
jgi:HPt (histidine-containing phosphotransfer) domain-containing protein